MTASDDTAFEHEVRAMLQRRAADIDPASLPPLSLPTSVPGNGLRLPNSQNWGRWPLAVAALAVVAALGAGAAIIGLFDSSVDIAATSPEVATAPTSSPATSTSTPTPDSAPSSARGPEWATSTPGIELLPPGLLQPSGIIFGPREEAATLAEDYLADRLPDLMAAGNGMTIEELETVDGNALFRWQFTQDDVDTAGWLYLLRADGSWWLVASVSEGVDAHRFSRDSQGLQGLVTSDGDEEIVLDLVDIESGQPFEPSTGRQLSPGPTGRRLGTAGRSELVDGKQTIEVDRSVGRQQYAIRIQAVGGTVLTITEFMIDEEVAETDLTLFVDPALVDQVVAALEADERTANYQLRTAADTRAAYYGTFNEVPEVTAIWDDAAEIESISLALATTEEPDVVIGDLQLFEGVLAVASTPEPTGADAEEPARAEPAANLLVIGSRSVPFRPEAITCEAAIGIETPPNSFYEVDTRLAAPTAEEALARFLTEAAEPPPWSTGYEQLTSPDGSVSFAYAIEPERFLGIIRVAEDDDGWAVTDWEIVGC